MTFSCQNEWYRQWGCSLTLNINSRATPVAWTIKKSTWEVQSFHVMSPCLPGGEFLPVGTFLVRFHQYPHFYCLSYKKLNHFNFWNVWKDQISTELQFFFTPRNFSSNCKQIQRRPVTFPKCTQLSIPSAALDWGSKRKSYVCNYWIPTTYFIQHFHIWTIEI